MQSPCGGASATCGPGGCAGHLEELGNNHSPGATTISASAELLEMGEATRMEIFWRGISSPEKLHRHAQVDRSLVLPICGTLVCSSFVGRTKAALFLRVELGSLGAAAWLQLAFPASKATNRGRLPPVAGRGEESGELKGNADARPSTHRPHAACASHCQGGLSALAGCVSGYTIQRWCACSWEVARRRQAGRKKRQCSLGGQQGLSRGSNSHHRELKSRLSRMLPRKPWALDTK